MIEDINLLHLFVSRSVLMDMYSALILSENCCLSLLSAVFAVRVAGRLNELR